MSELSPELQELEDIEGTVIPDTNVRLSRPTVKAGGGMNDTVAQITKIAVNQTPGDHFFKLTLPDKPSDFRGAIEVDDSQQGGPRLRILAQGIFKEPNIIGPLVRVGLEEAGVNSAIVEPDYDTNLSLDLLRRAGGTILETTAETSGEPLVAFEAIPSSRIHEPIAA
jgi:hypothetical protein